MPPSIEYADKCDFLNIAALDRIAWPRGTEAIIPDGEHVWRIWCEYATVLIVRHVPGGLAASGDIAGALVMFPTSIGENFLHKIMVHPDCRRQGLGTELMKAVLRDAAAPVLLTVDPQNEPAIQLYQSFGFAVRERVDGYYRSHEDRYLMVHPGCPS